MPATDSSEVRHAEPKLIRSPLLRASTPEAFGLGSRWFARSAYHRYARLDFLLNPGGVPASSLVVAVLRDLRMVDDQAMNRITGYPWERVMSTVERTGILFDEQVSVVNVHGRPIRPEPLLS